MPYLLFLKKQQNLKLSSVENYRSQELYGLIESQWDIADPPFAQNKDYQYYKLVIKIS